VEQDAASGRLKLTKEQFTAIQKALKEDGAEREKITKKSHEDLKALDDAANKAALELLSAHQRSYEELERTFQQRMQGMTAADHAAAEALLKKTHDNQLLAWAGFNAKLDEEVPHAQQMLRSELLLSRGVTEDFSAVLQSHGLVMSGAQKKALEHAAANRELRDSVKSVSEAVMNGADALGGMLEILGLADEKTRALTSGIGDLGQGISKALSGNIVGGHPAGAWRPQEHHRRFVREINRGKGPRGSARQEPCQSREPARDRRRLETSTSPASSSRGRRARSRTSSLKVVPRIRAGPINSASSCSRVASICPTSRRSRRRSTSISGPAVISRRKRCSS